MSIRRLKSLLAAHLLVFPLVAFSQVAASSAPTAQASAGLLIEVIAQPRQIELPGRFQIAFRLQNASEGNITPAHFNLEPVESPTPLNVSAPCDGEVALTIMQAGDIRTVTCTLVSQKYGDTIPAFFGSLLQGWSLLTLSPGDYQFVATVVGVADSGNKKGFTTSKAITVHLSPTVWQVVCGAALGSLLMAVFWISSPRIRAQVGVSATRGWGAHAVLLNVGKLVALWFGSTTAAVIAIFMTFRLKDTSLPLAVSVNDFYGGLVVGLFGVLITNWLGPKLFGKPDV